MNNYQLYNIYYYRNNNTIYQNNKNAGGLVTPQRVSDYARSIEQDVHNRKI